MPCVPLLLAPGHLVGWLEITGCSQKPRTVDAMVSVHLPRSPVPAWPARAPLILQRPTSPLVRDHANSIYRPRTVTIVTRSSQRIAPGTTDLSFTQNTTPSNHEKRPHLPRDAQFGPATRAEQKYPTLATAPLQQNAWSSCRRPTPPQMPPPSPRAGNSVRLLGNFPTSRGTWLAPPIAP